MYATRQRIKIYCNGNLNEIYKSIDDSISFPVDCCYCYCCFWLASTWQRLHIHAHAYIATFCLRCRMRLACKLCHCCCCLFAIATINSLASATLSLTLTYVSVNRGALLCVAQQRTSCKRNEQRQSGIQEVKKGGQNVSNRPSKQRDNGMATKTSHCSLPTQRHFLLLVLLIDTLQQPKS